MCGSQEEGGNQSGPRPGIQELQQVSRTAGRCLFSDLEKVIQPMYELYFLNCLYSKFVLSSIKVVESEIATLHTALLAVWAVLALWAVLAILAVLHCGAMPSLSGFPRHVGRHLAPPRECRQNSEFRSDSFWIFCIFVIGFIYEFDKRLALIRFY